jgi:predicted RNase H-like HicB family nuclease/predicted RNA binding protein YcfA (HicA-like mRNA interferase family)
VKVSFRVVIEKEQEDGGYYAYSPALPGCFSNGKTLEETVHNMREATRQHVASLLSHGQPVPSSELTSDTEKPTEEGHELREFRHTPLGGKLLRFLDARGFVEDRKTDSDPTLTHLRRQVSITIPVHGEHGVGQSMTLRILRDAGLSVDEFLRWCRDRGEL